MSTFVRATLSVRIGNWRFDADGRDADASASRAPETRDAVPALRVDGDASDLRSGALGGLAALFAFVALGALAELNAFLALGVRAAAPDALELPDAFELPDTVDARAAFCTLEASVAPDAFVEPGAAARVDGCAWPGVTAWRCGPVGAPDASHSVIATSSAIHAPTIAMSPNSGQRGLRFVPVTGLPATAPPAGIDASSRERSSA